MLSSHSPNQPERMCDALYSCWLKICLLMFGQSASWKSDLIRNQPRSPFRCQRATDSLYTQLTRTLPTFWSFAILLQLKQSWLTPPFSFFCILKIYVELIVAHECEKQPQFSIYYPVILSLTSQLQKTQIATHILQTAFYLWNKQNSLKLTYISILRMLTRRPSEAVTVANVVMMLCNKLTVDLFSSKREINTLACNILSVGGNQTLR